ncbi:hypothetical protein BD289DRAFT_503347 [Coniella lustricola]|uniref:Uncharacterized protein n=1 Tax=Coniella lustricola TaxID=2025994 RepID=A0A2T3AHY3_9PEZI|nr:hypothetical protein BD289DRAFT_503347 [Coniella lustricola]
MAGNLNPKTIMAPLAAFTMAAVLFGWTRSSIQAAKVNRATKTQEYKDQRTSGPDL